MLIPPFAPFKKNTVLKNGKELLREFKYRKYDKLNLNEPKKEGSLFRGVDRIRLVHNIVFSYIDFGEMEKRKLLIQHFPLHHAHNLQPLRENLLKEWRGYFYGVDMMRIRNYFGSKIAFYFAWLQFYLKWLITPAILGVIALILKHALEGLPAFEERFDSRDVVTFWYCIMIAMAATFFD